MRPHSRRVLLLLAAPASAEEPFSQDVCWDENCPDEVAACEANPVCKLIAKCIQEGASVLDCYNEYGSQTAADQAVAAGYTRVYNLSGGIDLWSQQVDSSVPRY